MTVDPQANNYANLASDRTSSFQISSVMRVTFGLSFVTTLVVAAALSLPQFATPTVASRAKSQRQRQATRLAVHLKALVRADRADATTTALQAVVASTPDLRFAQLQSMDGRVLAAAGRMPSHHDRQNVHVPISIDDRPWGQVTLQYWQPSVGAASPLWSSRLRLGCFLVAASTVGYYVFLKRTVGTLEAAVPPHFRATIDSLPQGLVVLDTKGRILLANRAFASLRGKTSQEIEGSDMAELPWMGENATHAPWDHTLHTGHEDDDITMRLLSSDGQARSLRVSSCPLRDGNEELQGVLASFDDVTLLEERNAELTQMLHQLRDSRDQIHRQNQELQVLATRDPLTHALNRRCFFDQLKNFWSAAVRYDHSLSCIMLDVDHFKAINDQHGHAVGDAVLRGLARVISKATRCSDIICRYGGEEFCILLPHTPMDDARSAAEKIRSLVATEAIAGVSCTVSLGVSSIRTGGDSPEQLIDRADRALYAAKNQGRNRVLTCGDVDMSDVEAPNPCLLEDNHDANMPSTAPIPFQTVSALTNALAYRDAATAEHSRRVADICVRFASDLMSMRECYILENAALLHDIGKIGVPDSILLKPGPLTDEEWKVMRSHDRIGQEIIRSTFGCEELAEIVDTHSTPFADGQPSLTLGARILAIADSFDSMVSDRVYRPGRSVDEAFAELTRCAGEQFDPELVELFISTYRERQQDQDKDSAVVNKKIALRLGIQIESLARALDSQDVASLGELTDNLLDTTAACHLGEVADLATQLNNRIKNDADWTDCVSLTLELLDCCRQAQRVHLQSVDDLEGTCLATAAVE